MDTCRPTALPPLMEEALTRESPRITPRPAPAISVFICVCALGLFFLLLLPAFYRQNLAAWSLGVAYVLYDTFLLGFTAAQIRKLRQTRSIASATRPTLAVIVAAHNEASVLGTTIAHLRKQQDPPDLIVIADDGSTDATADTLQRLYGLTSPPLGTISDAAPKLSMLKWARLPHGGKARALNQTIRLVNTDLVFTVDADTILDVGAVRAMRNAFGNEPELVAATGVLTPICGPSLSGRFFQWFQGYEYIRNFLSRYAWMNLNSLLLISGAFAAFRRDAIVTVGGFDGECLVEDYELIHRLHRHAIDNKLDWRMRVIGEAQAQTDAPATLPSFLRQRRRWFSGFLQTQYWNRDMIGNKRFGQLGTAMMVVKTFDTMQPIYGLSAFAILIVFLAIGKFAIVWPILLVMLAKIALDLAFHLWSLGIYARWTGQRPSKLRPALAAVFLEPFTFQLLRHAGAAWGWIQFIAGRDSWGRAHTRTALLAHDDRSINATDP